MTDRRLRLPQALPVQRKARTWHSDVSAQSASKSPVSTSSGTRACTRQMPELKFNDASLVQTNANQTIETILSRHFTFGFYELILLPGCSQHFFQGWLAELCQLARTCRSLYNSLLACAASHLYLMDGADTMLQLGLTYYSNSIQQLLKCLTGTHQSQSNDALLSAIIFLTIHGVRRAFSCST